MSYRKDKISVSVLNALTIDLSFIFPKMENESSFSESDNKEDA